MPEKKTTNSIHEEHRARMQERVARDGLTSLAAHEVLEYLLYFSITRRDTNPLANRLIQHFGGFCQVLDASEEELMQVQGIGRQLDSYPPDRIREISRIQTAG